MYCIFSTRRKLEWLKHFKEKHSKKFDDLANERRHYRKILDDALATLSDDDLTVDRSFYQNEIEPRTNSNSLDKSQVNNIIYD